MTGILQSLLGSVSTAVSVVTDAYFNLVTLLLPGNGTNGAQNNTFLDSSTNNFTITRNGNTTQGTFSPFSQTGWSNYFNGTNSDAIEIPNNAVFNFGTSDVTVEAWVYLNATNAIQNLIDCGPSSGSGFTSWTLDIDASGYIRFGSYVSGTNQQVSATSNALSPNQWYHIAFTRASGTNRLFVNGALCTSTGTFTQAIDSGGNTVLIGRGKYSGFTRPATGYFSNVRITKGGALYTAAFTPSTTPLTTTVSAGTVSLLTCQSNRFIDNSSNAFAVTVLATPSVQAFSPFAPTAAYSAATVGGSGYFDGTGDSLSLASNTLLNPGAGDFTIEAWVYPTNSSNTAEQTIIAYGTGSGNLRFQVNNIRDLRVLDGAGTIATGTSSISLNSWNHVVVLRSGSGANNVKLYVNGTQVAQATNTTNFSGTANIGDEGGRTFFGYISGLRFVKTQALASGNFTPPTVPVTTTAVGWTGANAASSITGAVNLLCGFTNAGITDATAKNVLETVGNAQISTTQSKFGGSSMYFDGTGDYLKVPSSPNLALGTGDFTVEFWAYPTTFVNFSQWVSTRVADDASYWGIDSNSSGVFYFFTNGIVVQSSAQSLNTWVHIAAVRSGTTFKLYINGVSAGSATLTNNFLIANGLGVGAGANGAQTAYGYIDDVRITRGYARYTSNFTPPTAAFALQ